MPGTTAYTYDQNGNLFSRINTVNPANNLSGITYNYLNLPNSVTAGSTAISYTYDATGNKLRKQVPSANINNEYISGVQYEGGVLKYVGTSEGRVVRNSATNYSYEYSLTDHLNNGRVYFDINAGAARAIQVTDYYAFGLDIQRSLTGTENKYQYNGKEKQDQEKLYDYGFRFYDPVVGRLSTIDPLAENHFDTNPYHYVLNNPMRYMDYMGLDTTYKQNNMTDKDWHNYKSGSDDINLNNVTIVGQRPGGNWGGFSGGFGNSDSWGNGFGGGGFGWSGFAGAAMPPPVLTSSSGPFTQLDNRGSEVGLTHAQELTKYGEITSAFSVSVSAALAPGFTYEYGWVGTNKNYVQYYQTVYYSHGIGFSAGANLINISANKGQHPTFSDWQGGAAGLSVGIGKWGLLIGGSSMYITTGGGIGFGSTFQWQEGRTAFVSVGTTTLLGQPILMEPRSNQFTNSYIRNYGQQ
nr:RHS repeat-associated core domain-containing protein [Pedobacter sp. ASV19]